MGLLALFPFLMLMFAQYAAWRFYYGASYAFRDDNFWAYSSGIYRRALPGELMYQIDRLTGLGPETLLAAIFISFAFVVLAVGRVIWRTISLPELILIVISPIVFFFEIDAEIFLFLPFLAIRYAPEVWRWPAILILIIIATSIREIAVILYSPVLLLMLTRCGWRMRIGAAAFLGVFTLSLVAPLGEATLFLETTYWPAQGIGGLADKSLYQFVNLSFSDLMREYHLPVLTEYGAMWVIPWIGLGMFLIAYVARETRSGLFTLWFLALYISISILSIDHGRYAYFCFCFAVLASSPSVRACFLSLIHI